MVEDKGLHITDPSALTHFSNDLGRFKHNAWETMEAIDTRLHAATRVLADRETVCIEELDARQRDYDASDDDARSTAWQARQDAEEALQNVRYWQRQLHAAVADYRRMAADVRNLLDQHTPKAIEALRQHTDLLYAYLAVPAPDAGGLSYFVPDGGDATTPAEAQVRISGFDRSPLSADAQVRTLLTEAIPAHHMDPRTLRNLTYEDHYEVDDAGILLGFTAFKGTHDEIHILRHTPDGACNPDDLLMTIAHEVGHHVQNYVLTEIRRTHWQELYDRTLPGGFVSDYAGTNRSEDFSECYATYIYDPDALLCASVSKYAFLRDHIFFGREYL